MGDSRNDLKEVGRLYYTASGDLFFQDYETGTTLMLKDGQIIGEEELTPQDAARLRPLVQKALEYFSEIAKRGLH